MWLIRRKNCAFYKNKLGITSGCSLSISGLDEARDLKFDTCGLRMASPSLTCGFSKNSGHMIPNPSVDWVKLEDSNLAHLKFSNSVNGQKWPIKGEWSGSPDYILFCLQAVYSHAPHGTWQVIANIYIKPKRWHVRVRWPLFRISTLY